MKICLYQIAIPLMARSDGLERRVEDSAADLPGLAQQPVWASFGKPSREWL